MHAEGCVDKLAKLGKSRCLHDSAPMYIWNQYYKLGECPKLDNCIGIQLNFSGLYCFIAVLSWSEISKISLRQICIQLCIISIY